MLARDLFPLQTEYVGEMLPNIEYQLIFKSSYCVWRTFLSFKSFMNVCVRHSAVNLSTLQNPGKSILYSKFIDEEIEAPRSELGQICHQVSVRARILNPVMFLSKSSVISMLT